MRPGQFLVVGCLLFALAGCSESPDQKLVGKWSGKFAMDEKEVEEQIKGRGVTGERAAAMREMMKNGSMELELNADKSFEMTMLMIPVKGTWSRRDQRLTLLQNEVAGIKVADMQDKMKAISSPEPMLFTASARFDALTMNKNSVEQKSELVLKKVN